MKTYLASLVAGASNPIAGRNLAREYLQAHILAALQRAGAMIPLAFHGGTALRFLYSMPRYCEDLVFALERPGRGYDLQACLRAVRRDFVDKGYTVEIESHDQRVVHSAFVRFPGLLYELGLSQQRDQVFAVKIEVDTHAPAGAGLETTIVRRHVMLHLQHHDRASLVAGASNPIAGRNLAREYLQAHILASLQRTGAMIPLAFHGGTALRFLYSMPRYSEDLVFALERPGRGYDLQACLRAVRRDFVDKGYTVEIESNDQRVVHSAFVRFPGLLHELGLSQQRDRVFAVKIEVDTHAPAGAGLERTIVRRHVILHLQHHDRASLLAGKLHALLARPYIKGRDVYDLLWYLSDPDWPAPNLDLLRNALRQTGWEAELPGDDTWRSMVQRRIESMDWARVLRDVRPFLETQEQMALLTRLNLERLLALDAQE